MTLTVLTPPQTPALSLQAAKAHLRIGHDGEDALVADLVQAATDRLETAAGLALVERTLQRELRAWPTTLSGRGYVLRPRPVRRVEAVTLIEADGTATAVGDRFDLVDGRLVLKPWAHLPPLAAGSRLQLRFVSGHDSDAVPGDLLLALKLLLAQAYRLGRQVATAAEDLPTEVAAILAARREVRL